ncbi:separin protein [Conoideocrella luteorostrata]|uniref:separase n=1 Tax=Conoideocrella luteorostrata TaxID=1105319 RepID=A0AAJ0CGD9_9HYPO|nr:separin protein [Conoideocrella luteorostrata]
MASLQASTDAVKTAISSTATCTSATVVTLKELLLVDEDASALASKPASRSTKCTTTGRSKPAVASKKPSSRDERALGARDRAVLATYVINGTLKALTEALKPLPLSTPCKTTENTAQSVAKRTLRRSLSAPLSPIQSRTLNRVATSPSVSIPKSKAIAPGHSTGCLAIVECARAAFACLRSMKSSAHDPQYDFQVENGMSAFIGKLLSLNLHDQALKEMRILKRRLEPATRADATKPSKSAPSEKSSVATEIADLLEFRGDISKITLPIITALQGHVLKLVCATKKPAHIDALLPKLQDKNPSSPVALLLQLAGGGEKQAQKASRQLATISQTLLSMLPSISVQEDTVASEPRLSPSPLVAFELQSLSFRTQLRWWKLAGHQGSIDDEVLTPFSRCIRALARRYKSDDTLLYGTLAAAYEALMQLIRSNKHEPSASSKSPLSNIYQLLGSTAHAARQYDGACCWFESLKALLCDKTDSAVVICSVSARILAAALKKPELDAGIERSIQEVIESLEGSLSGTVSELNELLESLSAVRRSVVGLLMKELDPKSNNSRPSPQSTTLLLKKFTLQYPRFVRRWMGTSPAKDASAKQILQFDQRKQVIMQSINQTLDATLMVVKCDIQSAAIEWQQMDDVLQHCTGLLDSVYDPLTSPARMEQLGNYHVKISTLYFSKFVELRKIKNRSKDLNKQLLQSLSRSIDSVKGRSSADKDKAQLSMKLELFADLCKGAGRSEDAVGTLRSICTSMAEDGVLSDVAVALTTLSPSLAWAGTEKASSLSRTLRSIAKLDKSWNDWTFFLPESERAAVLEHLMHLSAELSSPGQVLRLHDPSPAALLRIYTLEKYPVRRFRVLLHLLYQNIGEDEEAAAISDSLTQAVAQLQKKDRGEDSYLSQFIPHLQAYHSSMAALVDSEESFPSSVVSDNITTWKAMLDSCQSKADLYNKIDNPEALLEFLQAVNNLANLRGETQLQVTILELSIVLSRAVADFSDLPQDDLILNHNHLAAQYVNMGKYTQASDTLRISEKLLNQNEGVSRRVVADFYLSQADYYAGVSSLQEALDCIGRASGICSESYSLWAQSKAQANVMLSMVALVQSTVSLQTGSIEGALSAVKTGVRTLSHDWAKLEAVHSSSDSSISETSTASIDMKSLKSRAIGPQFWSLASPLLRCLLQLSSVYAHIGLFQETMFYTESARKIAESTQSSFYRAQVASWTGSVYLKAGQLPKALMTLEAAKDYMPRDACSSRVRFAQKLAELYSEAGEEDNANKYFSIAEETLRLLGGRLDTSQTSDKPIGTVIKAKSTVTRGARPERAAKAKQTTTTAQAVKRPATAKVKPPTSDQVSQLPKDVYQSSLLAAVLLSRAVTYIQKKDWSSALSTLEQAKELPKLVGTLSLEQITTATSLIGHSMDQMISDPVFSVMQDSTISFPAVSCSSDRTSIDSKNNLTTSPPKRGRSTVQKNLKEKGRPAFADALKQAQDILIGAHGSTLSISDSAMVHRLSTLLQNTIILLSATTATKTKAILSSAFASVAVDLGRNITWARELTTLTSLSGSSVRAASGCAEISISTTRAPTGLSPDMSTFQKTYVELLPKNWCVISLSLSDNRHDLSITKLQAGHSPFILRLPLERANSRDADSEVFNFEHGREELLDIIRLANETSHSARDFSAKGERNAWWAEREALDTRLKDLLLTVETTWLGGFKGIFSQHERRPDLLARFHKSFQQILDGSLPSRNRIRGKKTPKTQSINLDPRILDLFIGLGDPTDPDCDYDEALDDLLYFVVDILQFHGERNAYDEIDFDAMVVEAYDALRGYYSAAKSGIEREDGSHTILVLDKALHAFPWESLPCMQGLAVSRVPSLACLRQLITESNLPSNSSGLPRGHHVSRKAGTYILNPSSDLKNTQDFFQPSFNTLKGWNGIVNQNPCETEFEDALSKSEILLYFGHGSGAQYVRGKTIRRLEKCKPATFLMGCSSASLTEAGEFECYGPVWNYMLAGCPAVVGTLWDVTDRDIDRFAGRAFEEWGLFAPGTFRDDDKRRGRGSGKVNSRKRSISSETDDVNTSHGCDDDAHPRSNTALHSASLPEAVGKARGACKFRYLNAAAVVVYGIPVYVNNGS